ncbi:hypothetical protein ONS95_009979 [Cadophora gregata]|uniref:uncharacterized protein n=1 Tax=Cadophora gregata TaxID=51156 RepID=UPI0026DBD646|nr:uncharacterized protein ONS95_009979 [Cadophora gregata]KAK0121694.1 hypothetical protein ONS95_009979 [Cadophora gregata]KAK0127170.1 hypothetical protein ONS96_006723 [Cadophora gregata f. sp. sojae]
MSLVSAETLAHNNNKVVTTPFKTVHKHKLHRFPFRKSFKPTDNLCDIEEGEILGDGDEIRPGLKMPSSCLASEFEPDDEKFDLFFSNIPDHNAAIVDVKDWLKLWFDATLLNIRHVPNFLASIAMDGKALHAIQDFRWIENSLKNGNRIPNGDNIEWLPQDIVVNLAKYVFYAKEYANRSDFGRKP